MSYPTPFQKRTLWNAATGVSILILGLLLVGLIWLVGRVFGFLQPVLIPVIVAGIVAYVLDPVVRLLQKRGMSRIWAISSIYIVTLLSAVILLWTLLPGIKAGTQKLKDALSDKPQQEEVVEVEDRVDQPKGMEAALLRELHKLESNNPEGAMAWVLAEIDDDGNAVIREDTDIEARDLKSYSNSRGGRFVYRYKDAIFDTSKDWVTAGSSRILGFIGLALGMIMVPVYLFFFLKDSEAIRESWHKYIPLKASNFKTELVETLQEINGYLVSFFRGQVLVGVIDGILIGIVLTIIGLPYGFLIGVFMAILGVIPFIGNILCMIPAAIIAYLHAAQGDALWGIGIGPWAYVGVVIGIFLVVQQINSLLTAPKIVGDSVGLHPLTVIFSMLFWSLVLGGFIGALIAVPLTAAIKVLFRRYIWVRRMNPEGPGEDEDSDPPATDAVTA